MSRTSGRSLAVLVSTLALIGAALVLGQPAAGASASNPDKQIYVLEQAFGNFSGTFDGIAVWGQVGGANQTFWVDGQPPTTEDVAALTISTEAGGELIVWCRADLAPKNLSMRGLSSATLRVEFRECYDGYGTPTGEGAIDLKYTGVGPVDTNVEVAPGVTYVQRLRGAVFEGSITYDGRQVQVDATEGYLEKVRSTYDPTP